MLWVAKGGRPVGDAVTALCSVPLEDWPHAVERQKAGPYCFVFVGRVRWCAGGAGGEVAVNHGGGGP